MSVVSGLHGVLWCLLSLSATATPQRCEDLPPTSVKVTLAEADIETQYQYSYRSLKGMSARYADYGFAVLGLTTGQAIVKAKVGSQLLRDPGGRWECATHQVDLVLGYQPLKVYVGREFPQGSCAFQEIHQHEMRHADIYRQQARLAAAEVKSEMEKRFHDLGVTRGLVGGATARVQAEINDRWLPYAQRLLAGAESLQREVDTREEYERVAKSCGGEIQRVLGKR